MERHPSKMRRRIVELHAGGMPTRQIAGAFGVSRSGVRRVVRHARERGTHAPALCGGGRKSLLDAAGEARLRERVDRTPDATRAELRATLGIAASLQTFGRWLGRLGLTLKKSRSTPPNAPAPTWPRRGRTGTRT